MSSSLLERLHAVLGELRLTEADTLLESHLQRAPQGDRSYADFLLDLLESETRARQQDYTAAWKAVNAPSTVQRSARR